MVSRLEYGRVRAKSRYDEVMLLEEIRPKAAEVLDLPISDVGPGELMCYFAQRFAVKKIEVPEDFPAIHYETLHQAGYNLKVKTGPFFLSVRSRLTKRRVRSGRGMRHRRLAYAPPSGCCESRVSRGTDWSSTLT